MEEILIICQLPLGRNEAVANTRLMAPFYSNMYILDSIQCSSSSLLK